jgi:hypothetical protein
MYYKDDNRLYNTAGGIIVIGVEDKTKKVVRISNPLAEEERLVSSINDSICPLLMPDIEAQFYRSNKRSSKLVSLEAAFLLPRKSALSLIFLKVSAR